MLVASDVDVASLFAESGVEDAVFPFEVPFVGLDFFVRDAFAFDAADLDDARFLPAVFAAFLVALFFDASDSAESVSASSSGTVNR